MIPASYILSAVFLLSPFAMATDILPFEYSYPYGNPPGCCGGYYDDPTLSILNDGDKPNDISTTNSVEWDNVDHDYKPLLDLGGARDVEWIEVSYIVNLDWGKSAVKSVTCSASSEMSEYFNDVNNYDDNFSYYTYNEWDYTAVTTATTEETSYGGHTISLETDGWDGVRYIELSQIIPWGARAVITEVSVYGSITIYTAFPTASPTASPTTSLEDGFVRISAFQAVQKERKNGKLKTKLFFAVKDDEGEKAIGAVVHLMALYQAADGSGSDMEKTKTCTIEEMGRCSTGLKAYDPQEYSTLNVTVFDVEYGSLMYYPEENKKKDGCPLFSPDCIYYTV